MHFFLCVFLTLYLQSSVCAAAIPHNAPLYVVDLDEAPETRWIDLLLTHIENTGGWEYTYAPIFKFINTVLPHEEWVKYDDILLKVGEPIVGTELLSELKGIYPIVTKKFDSNVTFSQLVYYQIFYEIIMQCTGIIAEMPDGSRNLHGRNMDIGLPVSNVTAEVEWKKGGKVIAKSTQYLGYLGVHTGLRYDGWSAQINERVSLGIGPMIGWEKANLLRTFLSFETGGKIVGRYFRDILLEEATYDGALERFSKDKLGSPMYIILTSSEPGVGSVLTRDRNSLATHDQSGLKAPNGSGLRTLQQGNPTTPQNHSNYNWIVQTNWDDWIGTTASKCRLNMANYSALEEKLCEYYAEIVYGEPKGTPCTVFCQLYSDGRMEAAEASMANIAPSDVNELSLYNALSKPPVLAGITKFTSIMSPTTNSYQTVIRDLPASGLTQTTTEENQKFEKQINLLKFFMKMVIHGTQNLEAELP